MQWRSYQSNEKGKHCRLQIILIFKKAEGAECVWRKEDVLLYTGVSGIPSWTNQFWKVSFRLSEQHNIDQTLYNINKLLDCDGYDNGNTILKVCVYHCTM